MNNNTRSMRSVAAAVAMTLCVAAQAAAQVCGDVNDDAQVSATDALKVLKKAVGQDVNLICTDQCAVLEPRIAALEALLAGVSVVGDNLVVSGMNLQIVDGSGNTAGAPNGLGNLIVGYNENTLDPPAARTGSHNIIVGRENGYSSYGGLVGGYSNAISGPMASVTGGSENVASGQYSSVAGGQLNLASGTYGFVGGGYQNEASGEAAAVAGGDLNLADGVDSAIAGGRHNDALEEASSVAGGYYNQAKGVTSSVSGGAYNDANGAASSVTGGYNNLASGESSSISGGSLGTVDGQDDWLAGNLFQDY